MSVIDYKKGVTLVEILLYLGLLSIVSLLITGFAFTVVQSNIQNEVAAEVELQGLRIVETVLGHVRNAQSITSPSIGATDTSLTLAMASSTINPTVIDVSGDQLRITQGSGTAATLSSTALTISNVVFENLSQADTEGTIRFSFTASFNSSSSRAEYDYTRTFNGSASIR